jgi:hypothetical protein
MPPFEHRYTSMTRFNRRKRRMSYKREDLLYLTVTAGTIVAPRFFGFSEKNSLNSN